MDVAVAPVAPVPDMVVPAVPAVAPAVGARRVARRMPPGMAMPRQRRLVALPVTTKSTFVKPVGKTVTDNTRRALVLPYASR